MQDCCRICLGEPAKHDLFKLKDGNKSYSGIFQFCLGVQVLEDSKITTKLCVKCTKELLNFFEFKTLALQNNVYLSALCHENIVLDDNKFLLYVGPDNDTKNKTKANKVTATDDSKIKKNKKNISETDNGKVPIKGGSKNEDEIEFKNVTVEYLEEYSNLDCDSEEDVRSSIKGNKSDHVDTRNSLNQELDISLSPKIEESEFESENEQSDRDNDRENSQDSIQEEIYQEKEDLDEEITVKDEIDFVECVLVNRITEKIKIQKQPQAEEPIEFRNPRRDIQVNRVKRKRKPSPPGIHICSFPKCNKEFARRRALARHYESHVRPKEYCDTCERDVKNLEHHISLYHDRSRLKYQCEKCERRFVDQFSLLGHKCKDSRDYPFGCDQCDRRYKSKKNLRVHVFAAHTKLKNYICDLCSKGFALKTILTKHMRTHASKKYSCLDCGASFLHATELRVHEKSHTSVKPYKCEQCGDRFKRQGELNLHVRKRHEKTPTCYCEYCSKGFISEIILEEHIARQHSKQEPPYPCPHCDKVFDNRTLYKSHQWTHCKTQDYVCEECGRGFTNPVCLTMHTRRIHLKEKKVMCHLCPKEFFNKAGLKEHMNTHTSDRQIRCPEPGCDTLMKHERSLSRHLLLHVNSGPLACERCGKTFNSPYYLRRHMATHEKRKKLSSESE